MFLDIDLENFRWDW